MNPAILGRKRSTNNPRSWERALDAWSYSNRRSSGAAWGTVWERWSR